MTQTKEATEVLARLAAVIDHLTTLSDAELVTALGPLVNRDGGIARLLSDVRCVVLADVVRDVGTQYAAEKVTGVPQPHISNMLRGNPREITRPDWL